MDLKENDEIKVEKIDTITMYKMINSLLKYDYYSAKCLVGVMIEKRTNKEELKVLSEIRNLLFEYKNEEVFKILENKLK